MSDAFQTRASAVVSLLRDHGLDALLVSAPANLRYLTGYTGSNGMALVVAPDEQELDGEARAHAFFTDFRYETQIEDELADCFSAHIAQGDLFTAMIQMLGSVSVARLGFEADSLTVARHTRLSELAGRDRELVACSGLVERLREVKDEREIARVAGACELADAALTRVLEGGLRGRTEREVALDLETHMRRLGAHGPSFETIVAAGAHAALPHAQPRDVQIPNDVLVTIDWGAVHEGYCSDCTRTYAVGSPSDRAIEVYELVLAAQAHALAGLRPGITGKQADALARERIERAGLGERFGHGLGHGVGIEVHEGPRLSRVSGDETLQSSSVVTVEPGVYLPGEFGVRIEDLLVLGEGGNRNLSSLPKELTTIS